MPDMAVQFFHFHHLDFGGRAADRFDRLAEGLDPVADPQKPAYGAEPHAFQTQLQRLTAAPAPRVRPRCVDSHSLYSDTAACHL